MTDQNTPRQIRNPRLETLDCIDARMVELDLLEQALNAGRDLTAYKLQRLEDLQKRRKAVLADHPSNNLNPSDSRGLDQSAEHLCTSKIDGTHCLECGKPADKAAGRGTEELQQILPPEHFEGDAEQYEQAIAAITALLDAARLDELEQLIGASKLIQHRCCGVHIEAVQRIQKLRTQLTAAPEREGE